MKIGEIVNSFSNFDSMKLLKQNSDGSFANFLKQSIEQLNSEQQQAYQTMKDIATGKVENLQEAVKQIESAELSLKLALEVKNKAINAYKEVMRMQI